MLERNFRSPRIHVRNKARMRNGITTPPRRRSPRRACGALFERPAIHAFKNMPGMRPTTSPRAKAILKARSSAPVSAFGRVPL
jgi:hypothetical protein